MAADASSHLGHSPLADAQMARHGAIAMPLESQLLHRGPLVVRKGLVAPHGGIGEREGGETETGDRREGQDVGKRGGPEWVGNATVLDFVVIRLPQVRR